jgi:AcrR family transcriptional regulator
MSVEAITKTGRDERREAILKIAHEAFLASGYSGTSMSSIAARVGGSKATLYNYFQSKEDLFRAVVQGRCDVIGGLLDQGRLEGGDFATVLRHFGERFLPMVLSDEFIATYRMMIGETARFPEIGQTFYETGPQQSVLRLGRFMAEGVKNGDLRDEDPQEMAKYYFDMCMSDLHDRRLWNVKPDPTPEEIKAHVARAVSVFMMAFGAKRGV